MANPGIQIVSSESGEPTAVIVPIELWREIESERETAYLPSSETTKHGRSAGFQDHAQSDRQFEQEKRWLAENRDKFRGKWIALEGDHLFAVGITAKEVFSKVADQNPPPLVIRVAEEDLPFAGW
jgi:hypothetical protein